MPDLTKDEIIKLIAIATEPLNLPGADLYEANLSGANLTGVRR